MRTSALPEVGQEAPDFRLKGPMGSFYSLSEYRGDKHVVLVFFPLAFSATCTHQLPEVQRVLHEFEAADAVVFGISVDSRHSNAAFARQLGLTFPLLSDWDREASKAYGVLIPELNYARRSTFVVDKAGRIVHVEVPEDMNSIEHLPSLELALAAIRGD